MSHVTLKRATTHCDSVSNLRCADTHTHTHTHTHKHTHTHTKHIHIHTPTLTHPHSLKHTVTNETVATDAALEEEQRHAAAQITAALAAGRFSQKPAL